MIIIPLVFHQVFCLASLNPSQPPTFLLVLSLQTCNDALQVSYFATNLPANDTLGEHCTGSIPEYWTITFFWVLIMKARDLPFSYAKRKKKIFAVERVQKLFLSVRCLPRCRFTKKRQGRAQQIFSTFPTTCSHIMCCSHSQRTRQSLSPSSSPSSTVSIHLLITTKAQNTFQKDRINNKTNIAQNLVNRKPVNRKQVSSITM